MFVPAGKSAGKSAEMILVRLISKPSVWSVGFEENY